jgi:hypothetical protein
MIDISGGQKRPRKTLKVTEVLDMCNEIFANENVTQDEKRGITFVLEAILFGTKNYKGFMYIGTFTKETEYNRIYSGGKA